MARFVALIALLALVSVSTVHGNTNDTDTCLSLVNDWSQILPKTLDDLLKGDIFALMADIGKITPMINQTKNACGNASVIDLANKTTLNTFMTCYNSTGDVVNATQKLIADVQAGNISAVLQDVGLVIAAFNNVVSSCNATFTVLTQHPQWLSNFYNSTKCWAIHERSVVIKDELLYQIQQQNYTAALALVLPFVGSSAETFRQCSIYPNQMNFAQWWMPSSTGYNNYNFFEFSSNKSESCYGDILALVDGLLPVVKDLNTQNYLQLIVDGQKLIPIFMNTLKDCPSTLREVDFKPFLNRSALGDFATCIKDIQSVGEEAKVIIQDIKDGNILALMAEIPKVIELLKQTVKDCTNSGRGIEIQKLLNYYPSEQCSAASDKAGKIAREAREALHYDQEKFVAILPQWIEAAKLSFNTCHRAPFTF